MCPEKKKFPIANALIYFPTSLHGGFRDESLPQNPGIPSPLVLSLTLSSQAHACNQRWYQRKSIWALAI